MGMICDFHQAVVNFPIIIFMCEGYLFDAQILQVTATQTHTGASDDIRQVIRFIPNKQRITIGCHNVPAGDQRINSLHNSMNRRLDRRPS